MGSWTRRAVVAAASAGLIVPLWAGSAQAAAPALIGDGSIKDCLEWAQENVGSGWGCYEMKVVPNQGANAVARVSWNLHEEGENYNDANWHGGLVMTRWPIEGQWKVYPPLEAEYFPAGKRHEDCNSPEYTYEGFNLDNCYVTFTGATGTLDLVFPPSMAGYVYEVYGHDKIVSDDSAGAAPSGGMVGGNTYPYVFVFKASRYKDKKGKVVVTMTCPPAKQRKSSCQPAALAKVAQSIGGSPVTPP